MQNRSSVIVIKVILGDQEYELNTFRGEYRNLMMLIFDKLYTDDFGECKGIGRCGTCLIEILESENKLSEPERNENTTLIKTGVTNPDIRLACQLMVDESLNSLKIKLC